jgi:hypothetical protein
MKTIHEGIQDLVKKVESLALDAQKFDEGNWKAGTRVTKGLIALSRHCKVLRQGVLKIKRGRRERYGVKTR